MASLKTKLTHRYFQFANDFVRELHRRRTSSSLLLIPKASDLYMDDLLRLREQTPECNTVAFCNNPTTAAKMGDALVVEFEQGALTDDQLLATTIDFMSSILQLTNSQAPTLQFRFVLVTFHNQQCLRAAADNIFPCLIDHRVLAGCR